MVKRLLAIAWLLVTSMAQAQEAWRFVLSPDSLRTPVEAAVRPWRGGAADDHQPSEPAPADAEIAAGAEAAVRDTLKALGYYQPVIHLDKVDDVWTLQVEAGEPVRLHSVQLSWAGELGAARESRRPDFPLALGDILDQSRYEDFKQQVADLAMEQGYFDGRWVDHDIAIDLRQHQADITLRYDSGRRYHFGEVRFVDFLGRPLTGLDERWLRSLVPFRRDDPISTRKLLQLQKALLESRYFADVQVSLRHDEADGLLIPVEVRADNRKPNKMSVGIGYATDVGPRLQLDWQRPLLNEQGHGVEMSTDISPVRQSSEIKYRVPWTHPTQDTLQFVLGVQRDVIDDTTTRQTAVAVQRVIQPPKGWAVTYGVRVADEHYEQSDGTTGGSLLVVPGVSFSKTRSRGGLDPESGLRQFYQVDASSPSWLSHAEYLLLRGGWRWLDTYADRHMLLARLDTGAILSPDFSDVPPSVRFYAGGDNSVRGYGYRDLSPRDANGEQIGGQYLVAGSLEYNWRWRPSWRPALFIDAGNAFSTHWQRLAVGAGVGIRWISPVGPVRLDVAQALSEPGHPWRLHLTLGTAL